MVNMGGDDTFYSVANVGVPFFYFNLCEILEHQTYLPSTRT